MGKRDTWRETFSALGESLIEVLRAELAVIGEAWKRSGRHLAIALGLLAVAGYIALVCLPALLIFALVMAVHTVGVDPGQERPLWLAALLVAGVVALIVAVLAWLALKRLRERCENPVATVQQRVADHTAWWNDRVLKGLEQSNETAGASDGADNDGDRSAGEQPSGS